MFKQDSQSIQQLLVAEKRAEDRVNQARKRNFCFDFYSVVCIIIENLQYVSVMMSCHIY